MTQRIGDWMTTFTGRKFWPLDPRPEEIYIEDIAHALSLMCRFNGHCAFHYSVAQHSCYVAELVAKREPKYALTALLHDAAEAYLADIIRPVKRFLLGWQEIDSKVMHAIVARYNLARYPMPEVVAWADNVMLAVEHRDIIPSDHEWSVDVFLPEATRQKILEMSPSLAEALFLQTFSRYETQLQA